MPKTPQLVQNLAVNVRVARLHKGMTQEDLAKKSGLSLAYISLIERGGRNAPIPTIEKIAKALGREPLSLLFQPSPEALEAAKAA